MTSTALKMLMVYSDKQSAELGAEVAGHLRHALESNFEIAETSWNAELLRSPKLAKMAAQDAMESNIVIISTSEARTLPAELNSWIEMWRDHRPEGPAALVALLNKNDLVQHREDNVQRSLRQTARRAHMDFFCHTEGMPLNESAKHASDEVVYADPSGKFKLSFVFKKG